MARFRHGLGTAGDRIAGWQDYCADAWGMVGTGWQDCRIIALMVGGKAETGLQDGKIIGLGADAWEGPERGLEGIDGLRGFFCANAWGTAGGQDYKIAGLGADAWEGQELGLEVIAGLCGFL